MASTTFPDATTTGVPAGTTLTTYTGPMTITQDGTVIDGKIINGSLRILADNVVIKNSKINFNGYFGIDAEGSKNLTVQDSDITGPGYNGTSNSAILGGGTFLRNDISKTENGIVLQDTAVVKGNYIHDLQNSGSDPHYDGISVQGGQDGVLIEGNTIIARDTSNIIINNNFGPVNDVTIRNNFLGGSPGINIYIHDPQTTNVTITGNYIAKGGYDYFSIYKTSPVISGNTLLPKGTMPSDLGDIDGGAGGDASGNIGGDTSGGSGEDTGGSTGPDTGDNTGGDTGGSTGGDTGGSTGGDTGGSTGTGGGTGGSSGSVKTFTGTEGDDVLPANGVSNGGNEKFYGRGGNDVLRGGAGADHLDGGDGSDTASYAGSNTGVNVYLKTGKGYGGHAEGDTIVSIGHLIGSTYGDKLYGNDNVNILDGGAGADILTGYKGNDSYVVDNARDVVNESSGGGRDLVKASVSFTLGANVENLTLTGSASINAIGNSGANVLSGNGASNLLSGGSGSDTLRGYGGNDALRGGFGNDILEGGAGKDSFYFDTPLSAANNVDRITDFSVVDDIIRLDNVAFTALTKTGTLASWAFHKSTTGLAHDANDRIIYETDTGKLFYDSNGSAAGGSVHFATLHPNRALTAADFQVI